MSMFEDGELQNSVTPEPEEQTFEPAGDDYLNSYLEELEVPKQDQPTPEIPSDEEYLETKVIEDAEPYTKKQYDTSQTTAQFVVKTADDLLAFGFTTLALEKDSKPFKAPKGELDEISKHLSQYFAENSMNLPPWVMAAIPFLLIVTDKFNVAMKLRKVNLEKKKTEDELARVKRELDKVKLEKKLAESKSELEKIKE